MTHQSPQLLAKKHEAGLKKQHKLERKATWYQSTHTIHRGKTRTGEEEQRHRRQHSGGGARAGEDEAEGGGRGEGGEGEAEAEAEWGTADRACGHEVQETTNWELIGGGGDSVAGKVGGSDKKQKGWKKSQEKERKGPVVEKQHYGKLLCGILGSTSLVEALEPGSQQHAHHNHRQNPPTDPERNEEGRDPRCRRRRNHNKSKRKGRKRKRKRKRQLKSRGEQRVQRRGASGLRFEQRQWWAMETSSAKENVRGRHVTETEDGTESEEEEGDEEKEEDEGKLMGIETEGFRRGAADEEEDDKESDDRGCKSKAQLRMRVRSVHTCMISVQVQTAEAEEQHNSSRSVNRRVREAADEEEEEEDEEDDDEDDEKEDAEDERGEETAAEEEKEAEEAEEGEMLGEAAPVFNFLAGCGLSLSSSSSFSSSSNCCCPCSGSCFIISSDFGVRLRLREDEAAGGGATPCLLVRVWRNSFFFAFGLSGSCLVFFCRIAFFLLLLRVETDNLDDEEDDVEEEVAAALCG